jgi:hypothetical protein
MSSSLSELKFGLKLFSLLAWACFASAAGLSKGSLHSLIQSRNAFLKALGYQTDAGFNSHN